MLHNQEDLRRITKISIQDQVFIEKSWTSLPSLMSLIDIVFCYRSGDFMRKLTLTLKNIENHLEVVDFWSRHWRM